MKNNNKKNIKKTKIFGVISVIALLLFSATLLFNNTTDAGIASETSGDPSIVTSATTSTTTQTSTTYDYIVSSKYVKNSAGKIVYTGSSFTTALNWATQQAGKIVYVPAGTYDVTSYIFIGNRAAKAGSTLIGAGDGPTGTVLHFTKSATVEIQGVNNAVVKNLRITGLGGVRVMNLWGSTNTIIKNILIQDVTCDKITRPDAAFQVRALGGASGSYGIIDGVKFIRCEAISPKCSGWYLCGDLYNNPSKFPGQTFLQYTRSHNTWVKNVYFEDCVAYRCGVDGRPNPYVCGYNLAECTNVENIKLVRCQSDYSWMNGYHFEGGPKLNNVVFSYSDASYNGVGKVSKGANSGWNYWSNSPLLQSITLSSCTGTGNYGKDVFNGKTHYDI